MDQIREDPVDWERLLQAERQLQSMDPMQVLSRSRALWNQDSLDLKSDEILAQILDRGSLEDWRALHQLMKGPGGGAQQLRERVHRIIFRVPTGYPRFWQAALAGLGHPVDWGEEPRRDLGAVEL